MTSPPELANRNTLWATVFVDELHRAGVDTACIAPGSRSAPLVLALARHGGFRPLTVIDERSAGFFAVGHGKATGRPVALVCTSGTAAANFHPAVLEAAHAGVPLIVLTADRPPQQRDTGAGQTIDQLRLYGPAVRWFCEVGLPELTPSALAHLRVLADRAVFEALRPPAGPVHLNFPFEKPLEPTPVPGDVPPELARAALSPAHRGPRRRVVPPLAAPPADAVARVAGLVRERERGLIVCGPHMPAQALAGAVGDGAWPAAVAALARHTDYPVLAEPASQVRGGPHDKSDVIAHGEALLRARVFRERLAPELVLRFGGAPTAAAVETLLAEHPDCPVVLVEEGGRWLEPTHHPGEVIAAEPTAFCQALAEALSGERVDTRWRAGLRQADRLAAAAMRATWESWGEEWFEGRVFDELAALLPPGAVMHTASSMPVRDLDAFWPVTATPVLHLVNRGTNGIDGTLSAAAGAAAAARTAGRGPTVLVTGDLAFHHDANGLQAIADQALPLTIVLLNNGGGGIFAMLPIADYGEPYETHFGTPHRIDFAALSAAYGVPHVLPASWAEFREQVRAGLAGPGPRVIELRTDRVRNREQHRAIWAAVAERLAAAFPTGRRL